MKEREDLSQIIEQCLQAMAAGATIEQVLAMYPRQGDELRQALQIAQELRWANMTMRVPGHAQAASKAQFLAHAEQLRKPRGMTALRLWLSRLALPRPNLGSLVFGLSMLALLLLAISSTMALPGDSLYPVKLAAQQASLSIIEDPAVRLRSEQDFDLQRAEEVQKLLVKNREDEVSFAGILNQDKNGDWQVADIPLIISENLLESANSLTGVYVEIRGHTHEDGHVHVEMLNPRLFKLEGVVKEIQSNGWVVGGLFVQKSDETVVLGELAVNSRVSMEIARLEDSDNVLAFSITVLPSRGSTATLTSTPRRDPVQGPAPTLTPDDHNDDEPPAATATPTRKPTDHDDDDDDDDDEGDKKYKSPTPAIKITGSPTSRH